MKRCGACGQEFQDRFNFCPVDGGALVSSSKAAAFEYRPTIISDRSLPRRLAIQIDFLVERAKSAWPRFRSNPRGFLSELTRELAQSLRLAFARPYFRTGLLAACTIVLCIVGAVTILEKRIEKPTGPDDLIDPTELAFVNFPPAADTDSKAGVGASEGENGRVGFAQGRGEGSGPTPARAHGGGGGGNNSPLEAVQGRIPRPSEIPAPITTTYSRMPSLPDAGINLDPVLYKDLPFPNYGDPRSKSTMNSNGPGSGGGFGAGKGTGIGPGTGPGVGPGDGGNMGGDKNARGCCGSSEADGNNPNKDLERVFRQTEVNLRARVISKPEPQYTEEARRNQITGKVVLSVVFDRTGQVTNIRAVQTLCCGLTEKAIAAARQIRFVPAMRDGQVVSVHMQLEYNFNLY
jgi:TonB family protein